RQGGAGSGPFTFETLTKYPDDQARCAFLAVVSPAPGEAVVAHRSPGCSPYGLTTTHVATPWIVGVDTQPSPRATAATVRPNPARSGDALHVEFRLSHDAPVELLLHDLA